MIKTNKMIALVIFLCLGISYGAEYDIKTITTIMDAYEKQLDSIKLKYSFATSVVDKEGNREFVKGTFAQKKSEGFILLDEMWQKNKKWDDNKEPEGTVRSYNGKVTRYLVHEKNDHGYHMAALYENHNSKLYKTRENPYYRVWHINYKHKLTDLLNDPNGMAKIQSEELINGSKAVKINFKGAEGVIDCYLWLLPEKNYLPIKCEIYNKNYKEGKERLQEIHWSEFKDIGSGIWYPMNINLYYGHIEEPTTIKIEEMDISPLTKEDFEFKFPAFTHVTDHLIGASYLTTMPLEHSGLEQNPSVLSLSNKEKEEVLDKFLESIAKIKSQDSHATKSNDLDVTDTEVKITSKTNLKEKTNETPYWPIMFAFIFVGICVAFIFKRRKKA